MYMYIHVWVPRFNHQNIGIQRIPVGGSVHLFGTGILSAMNLTGDIPYNPQKDRKVIYPCSYVSIFFWVVTVDTYRERENCRYTYLDVLYIIYNIYI